jgi:tRNA A-37 threonylcarbamoyl transferase component Bud32
MAVHQTNRGVSMIEQIGRYRITKELGQGGFGDVYLAEDTVLGNQVALKVLAAHYLRNPTIVERFRQEARAAARLQHPNIVRIYDLGEAEGILYLVMDYRPGRTLGEVIDDEGPLPLERTAGLLTQIASALDYAHDQGLVHRDVKPGNVIVGEEDRATLTDFGLVKAMEGTEYSILQLTAGSDQFTSSGTMIGTPEYMAPEQAEPGLGPVDGRIDVYALGVIAYQMLTGRVPFKASTPVATLRGHVDLEPPPPGRWVDLPQEATEALMRALAKKPEERWERAGEFAAALAEAAHSENAVHAEEQEVAALYAQAREAAERREWTRALSLCGQVMERRPGYEAVDALFMAASEGLTRQKHWETQQEEVAALYQEAERQMDAEDWEGAIANLQRILGISGEYVYRDTPQRLAQAVAVKERAETERLARAEELHDEVSHLLRDLAGSLAKLSALGPPEQSPHRQQRLAETMLNEWMGQSSEGGYEALTADVLSIKDSPSEPRRPSSYPGKLWPALMAMVGAVILGIGLMALAAWLATPSNPHRARFEVNAATGWQDTGVVLAEGDVLTVFYVAGTWSNCAKCPWPATDADGLSVFTDDYHANVVTGCRHGALVAQIADGEPFCIGVGFSRQMFQSGSLKLGTNDQQVEDNEGVLGVYIETKRPAVIRWFRHE